MLASLRFARAPLNSVVRHHLDKSLQISKLDAAKRQLESAVRMYFHYGDPVSIHTLVAAGYNVVRDINMKRGGSRMMVKDMLFDQVKPEMHSEFRALLNKAENFFKHADRDHDATLDFNPDETDLLIFDACSKYWELSGENPPLIQIYRGWFMVTHPHLFTLTPEMTHQLSRAQGTTEGGRTSYLNLMLPLVMKSGV